MKQNTLSLSLLLSAALVVPAVAMADSMPYDETAEMDTIPAEKTWDEESNELAAPAAQPNIDNGYETETIDENDAVDPDSEALNPQYNDEEYPPAVEPTDNDYAPVEPIQPAEPALEAPIADDTFQGE